MTNSREMPFNPGFEINPTFSPMGFEYGNDVFGPKVENRMLNDIRKSLMNPTCEGPEIVYSIAMDVGKKEHKALLEKMHLLYGVVTYAAGRLGDELSAVRDIYIKYHLTVDGLLPKCMKSGRVKLLFICRNMLRTIRGVVLLYMQKLEK